MLVYSIVADWCNLWILEATSGTNWLSNSVRGCDCPMLCLLPSWKIFKWMGMEISGWAPIWNVKQGLQEMSWCPTAPSPQLSQISEFHVQGEIHGSGAGVEIVPDQMGPPVRRPIPCNVKVSGNRMEPVHVCNRLPVYLLILRMQETK